MTNVNRELYQSDDTTDRDSINVIIFVSSSTNVPDVTNNRENNVEIVVWMFLVFQFIAWKKKDEKFKWVRQIMTGKTFPFLIPINFN